MVKSLAFAGLLLLMTDAAVRKLVMDTLVGVLGRFGLVQASEPWLIQMLIGMLIAVAVEFRSNNFFEDVR